MIELLNTLAGGLLGGALTLLAQWLAARRARPESAANTDKLKAEAANLESATALLDLQRLAALEARITGLEKRVTAWETAVDAEAPIVRARIRRRVATAQAQP